MTRSGRGPSPYVLMPDERPVAFLDANVLLPTHLRAVFLDLAHAGLMRVHWGPRVLEELRHNLEKRFGLSAARADKLLLSLANAFPDALVSHRPGVERRLTEEGMIDAKDCHVAAGALRLSRSRNRVQRVALVTQNIKDLPPRAFAGTAVHSLRPDTFLVAVLNAHPVAATILHDMIKRFRKPPLDQAAFLTVLDNARCSRFAEALANAWGYTAAH